MRSTNKGTITGVTLNSKKSNTSRQSPARNMLNSSGGTKAIGRTRVSNDHGMPSSHSMLNNSGRTTGRSALSNRGRSETPSVATSKRGARRSNTASSRVPGNTIAHNVGSRITEAGDNVAVITDTGFR